MGYSNAVSAKQITHINHQKPNTECSFTQSKTQNSNITTNGDSGNFHIK